MCSICQFLWCKYSYHDSFLMSLRVELRRNAQIWLGTSLGWVLKHVGSCTRDPSTQCGGAQTAVYLQRQRGAREAHPRLLYTRRRAGALAYTASCMETRGTTHGLTGAHAWIPRPEGAREETQRQARLARPASQSLLFSVQRLCKPVVECSHNKTFNYVNRQLNKLC